MLPDIENWWRSTERDAVAVWLAARDPRVPWYAKSVAVAVAAYALSPIDLIPDFVPVLGYVDDLLIVPAGIWFVVHIIPAALVVEFRAAATDYQRRPRSRAGAAMVVTIWLLVVAVVAWWIGPRSNN